MYLIRRKFGADLIWHNNNNNNNNIKVGADLI